MSSDLDINVEIASKNGLTFNNSPTAKPSDWIFTGVDWSSGELDVDQWTEVLSQDVFMDGNEFSVRSKYQPGGDFNEALYRFAYLINDEVVLEIDVIGEIHDDFLSWQDTTGNALTGDQILQLLLTGTDSKIHEAIFSGSNIFNLSNGNDVVYGYAGDDTINAKGGDDIINGGPGDDTLNGDDGNDTIDGGGRERPNLWWKWKRHP